MAATAAIVLKLALRALVDVPLGATVLAPSVASLRTATGIMAIAAIVHKRALRVPVALVHLATVGATKGATSAASTRRATGMVATAATSLMLVI